jgi:hypothetical protein
LALHESFRRLNFPAEELYVETHDEGVVLFALHHGGKKFRVNVDVVADLDKLCQEWIEATAWWNGPATEMERQTIYEGSEVAGNRVGLVTALAAKGLVGREDTSLLN